MKKLIIILSAFVLMGMSDVERRAEQKRIEEMVNRTVIAQTQPSPKRFTKNQSYSSECLYELLHESSLSKNNLSRTNSPTFSKLVTNVFMVGSTFVTLT